MSPPSAPLMLKLSSAAAAAALLITTSVAAQTESDHTATGHRHTEMLGEVSFPNSGNRAAQRDFTRGLAFLHSFEYRDAAEAFRAARQRDPSFAMAYWMEALTYRHPLRGQENLAAARAALLRLGATPAERLRKAGSARERAYGAAVEALYADAPEVERARAFADSIRSVAARYKDDLEAAAFASLAFQAVATLAPIEQRPHLYDSAIALGERVFKASPRHPGGIHYLIHAFDHPARARRGLEVARLYARVAPDADHALHMPSHIFVQIGEWADVVSSNERSWAASRAWVRRNGLSAVNLDFHSLTWLQYGYLQQGRYRAARALIDTARALLGGVPSNGREYPDATHAVPRLEFQYIAETGRWAEFPARAVPDTLTAESSRRLVSFVNAGLYAEGLAAAMRGDSAFAFRRMGHFADVERRGLPDYARQQGAPSGGIAARRAAKIRAVMQLRAGDARGVLALLDTLTRDEVNAPVAGPVEDLPAAELFGNALLAAGRAKEAEAVFSRALERTPKRSQALLGLARARQRSGDRAGAAAAYRALLVNWKNADPDVPELDEVRRGAGLSR